MAGRTSEGSLRKAPKGDCPCWVRGRTACLQLRVMRPGKTAEDKRIGAWKGNPGSDPPPSILEGEITFSRSVGAGSYEDIGERHEKSSGKTCLPLQQGGNAQRPQEIGQTWLSEAQGTLLKTLCKVMTRSPDVERESGPVRRLHQTGYTRVTANHFVWCKAAPLMMA